MNLGHDNYFLRDPIWYNKNVGLKTKCYFHYPVWHNCGISNLGNLCRGHNFVKTFEDLVLEYDISIKDRCKYNSLMNSILLDWFDYPIQVQDSIFDEIVETLFGNVKVTRSSYNIFKSQEIPVNAENFWIEALDIGVDDNDWAAAYSNNFNCTIEMHIRAFYFKIFHRAICTNYSSTKLVELILLYVISVKNLLNLIFICFVTLKKLFPCGVNWAPLLIKNVVKI